MMLMKAQLNIVNNLLILHVQKAWVSKAALVSNDLSKHQEFKTFSNKQNTMLKVLLKTY